VVKSLTRQGLQKKIWVTRKKSKNFYNIKIQNNIFSEVYRYLEQGSQFVDKRHLTVISWIVTALLSSQSLNQARWEPYVQSRAEPIVTRGGGVAFFTMDQ